MNKAGETVICQLLLVIHRWHFAYFVDFHFQKKVALFIF